MMAGESLLDLGILLNNEFQALLGNYTSGWLADNVFRSEDWQEIALLCQEFYQVEQAMNELEVWENLLTRGFIPSDLASSNNSNQGKESASDEPARIHPYLETWKTFESLVNSETQISPGKGKFSYPKLVRNSDPSDSQKHLPNSTLQGEGKGINVFSEAGKTEKLPPNFLIEEEGKKERLNRRTENLPKNHAKAENRAEISLGKKTLTRNDLGLSSFEEEQVFDALQDEIEPEYYENLPVPNGAGVSQKTSQSPSHSATHFGGIKGLKDLSAFLATQPNKGHIIETDLTSNSPSETLKFSGSELAYSETLYYSGNELANSGSAKFQNPVTYFTEEEVDVGMRELTKIESERSTEIGQTTELDIEMIVDVIAQQINREYRRFYGE